VTTDRSNCGVSHAITSGLDADGSTESVETARRTVCEANAHPLERAPMPSSKPPATGQRPPYASSQSTGRAVDAKCVGIGVCRSTTQQLFLSAAEDLSRLTEILRCQRCTAVMRGIDGVVIPISAPASKAPALGDAPALCAPIYDAEGNPFASLEVIHGGPAPAEASGPLMQALIEAAAGAITERWFRLAHRRQWVIAATRRRAPEIFMLLAVDRDRRMLGADRNARQSLGEKGRRFEKSLPLSTLFYDSTSLLRLRGYRDLPITLLASSDATPWNAIVTPPDVGTTEPSQDARAVLHARPRLDSLRHFGPSPAEDRGRRGLSHAALMRVEEYIDTHLDSALDIHELAAVVRMSPSHFTRSFHDATKLTPHKYVIEHRVMKARELLATTDLPLTDIALTMGFSDQSHFSRRFHELVGLPPGAFREQDGRLDEVSQTVVDGYQRHR